MVIVQLDSEQLSSLIQNAVRKVINESTTTTTTISPHTGDEMLTIQQAGEFLKLTVPTIYGLVSKAKLPVSKRGKRLYFSKQELTEWIKAGRKPTVNEIERQAEIFLQRKRKRG